MKKVYLYSGYERLWHWTQMVLIMVLIVTGFEVHGTYSLLGFITAVLVHDIAAISLVVLTVFTLFWDFVTGEWRQYIPTTNKLIDQVMFYIKGIFLREEHPVKKTIKHKFNPIQGFVYVGLKLFMLPLVMITGVVYFFYQNSFFELEIASLEPFAILHTIGAFLIVMFVIVHVYLITTGATVFSNLWAMITGWEEMHDEEVEAIEKELSEENKKFFNIID
ncbi:MAG: cytochrome b/b6 domain-containing protein [Bacteroidota bacterium]|nr:cytochrome b/b6 domain-containing protein [Bacteroidota bacterium]